MRREVRFYENVQSPKDVDFYLFDDIITKWSDYTLQVRKTYITWLFPLETDDEPKLTSGLVYKFRTNERLRRQVVRATLRMMSFFGYTVNPKTFAIVQIKPTQREENHVIIGLYNPDNYPVITRIMQFLTIIRMDGLSALFFLMLCQAAKEHPDLKFLFRTKDVIREWVKTQPYLNEQRYLAEEAMIGEEIESWEKSIEEQIQIPVKHDAWDD